jgi:hypothetical protein
MGWVGQRKGNRWATTANDLLRWNRMIDDFQGLRRGGGIALERGEIPYATLEDASLIEVQREAGRWEGSSSGISLPLPVLGSMYSGRSSSQYVPGRERPTELDKGGIAYVTSTRVAFAGNKQTREWRFKDLLRVAPGKANSFGRRAMYIAVSRRQRVSALGYPSSGCEEFEFLLGLALARHLRRVDEFREELLAVAGDHYSKAPRNSGVAEAFREQMLSAAAKHYDTGTTALPPPPAQGDRDQPGQSVSAQPAARGADAAARLGRPRQVDGWTVYEPTPVVGADGVVGRFHITNDSDDPSMPLWYSYWPDTERDTDGEYYDSPRAALDALVVWAAGTRLGTDRS